MAVDRSKQVLTLYTKAGVKIVAGAVGVVSVVLTKITAGTVIEAGDYQVAWSEAGKESDKVDVPAFTVPVPTPSVPTAVKSVATADGANITAE